MADTALPPISVTPTPASIILDATRCWRSARDGHQPVQPALYQSLKTYRCDVLTPVLDSLLALQTLLSEPGASAFVSPMK